MISEFKTGVKAAKAVVQESYKLWLQYDVRTDDITMIMAFLDWSEADGSSDAGGHAPRLSKRESRRGSANNIGIGLDVVSRAGGENRPVRRGLSKEKRKAMMVQENAMAAEEDDSDWTPEKVPKSPPTPYPHPHPHPHPSPSPSPSPVT